MKQYKQLLEHILTSGSIREDRTGTGTMGVFGYQMRFDLQEGFPLVTTKKTALRLVFEELMWFLRGETNITPLLEKNVHIWDKDAFRWHKENVGLEVIDGFRKEYDFPDETEDHEIFARALLDGKIDSKYGELGPVYGKQWRSWSRPKAVYGDLGMGIKNDPVDQITNVIKSIKEDPYGRRHIVSAWNPAELDDMALPPCHIVMQFYVDKGELSCQLYQRSADVFLGVPFNIASYALLTHLIAMECDLEIGDFIHTLGDAHIYRNHQNQALEQVTRKPKKLPRINFKVKRENIWDYEWEDIELIGYDPHPRIKGEMST